MSLAKGAAANVDGFWSIPASWAWTTVEAVGGVGLGRQRSPENHSGPYMRQYVRAANISWSGWELSDVLSMNFDPDDFERFRLCPGDVLLNEGSGSSAEVGKSAIWRGQIEDCCFQNTLLRVQPKAVSPEFLQLYFMLAARSGRFVPETQGVNIFHIGKAGLAKFPVPVPPPAEQRRVVSKLDNLRSRSARARHELDHIPKLIERYKQTILAKAFSGELTAQWRAAHGAPSPISYSISGIDGRIASELPELPDTWKWTSVHQVAVVTGGLTKNSKRGEVPSKAKYLRVANVYANELRLDDIAEIGCTAAELEKTRLACGDLLIVEGNGSLDQIGRVALWSGQIPHCSHQNHIIRARPLPTTVPKYGLYWLLSPIGRTAIERVASSSSGLHTLSISKVSALPIPMCPEPEQAEIVHRIDHAFAWLNKIAIEHARAEHLLPKLDQAILAKAFRGELVPQNPNDEPASALLERVKAARNIDTGARRRGPRSQD